MECYDFSTSNQHRQLLPLCIVALLVYVIGIPVLFGILLFRYRKVSRPLGSAVPLPPVSATSSMITNRSWRHCLLGHVANARKKERDPLQKGGS